MDTLFEAFETAKEIQFKIADAKEPLHKVAIFFEEQDVAIVCYESVIEINKAHPLKLGFARNVDNLIVSFLDAFSDISQIDFTLNYGKEELNTFTKTVGQQDRFVVLFGFIDGNQKVIVTTANSPKPEFLSLTGYKI